MTLVAESDTAKYDQVKFAYRRSDADPWVEVPAANVTKDGSPVTWPVALGSGGSEPLVWNVTDTLAEDGAVQVRAEFTGPGGSGASNPIKLVVDRNADSAAGEEVGRDR